MSKEVWFKAYEHLETELGREPNGDEVDALAADLEAALIDDAYERFRDEETP